MKNNKTNSIFKLILLFLVILLPYIVNAKTYKLDYQPHDKIIIFKFDSITIYTDTTSLFSLCDNENSFFIKNPPHIIKSLISFCNKNANDLQIINSIKKSIRNTKNDTVTFVEKSSSVGNNNLTKTDIKRIISQLIQNEKVKIIDENKLQIRRIKIKQYGNITDGGHIKFSYINNKTKKEIFYIDRMVLSTPNFWLKN